MVNLSPFEHKIKIIYSKNVRFRKMTLLYGALKCVLCPNTEESMEIFRSNASYFDLVIIIIRAFSKIVLLASELYGN